MPTLAERFGKKEPRYPNRFRDLMERISRKRAFDTSAGTEEEKYAQGKVFSNFYECFIYATIIGLRKGYRVPFDRASEGAKFLIVDSWTHRDLVNYLLMSLLAVSDIELIDLEELDEEQTDEKALELVKLMEEYAHGGLEYIQSRLEDEPHLFEDPYGAVGLLKGIASTIINF